MDAWAAALKSTLAATGGSCGFSVSQFASLNVAFLPLCILELPDLGIMCIVCLSRAGFASVRVDVQGANGGVPPHACACVWRPHHMRVRRVIHKGRFVQLVSRHNLSHVCDIISESHRAWQWFCVSRLLAPLAADKLGFLDVIVVDRKWEHVVSLFALLHGIFYCFMIRVPVCPQCDVYMRACSLVLCPSELISSQSCSLVEGLFRETCD